jgi:hypothetical protein
MMPTMDLPSFFPNNPFTTNPIKGKKGINGISAFIVSIFSLSQPLGHQDSKAIVKIILLEIERFNASIYPKGKYLWIWCFGRS